MASPVDAVPRRGLVLATIIASVAMLAAVFVVTRAYLEVRTPTEVSVRGSAKQEVASDWIVWRSDVSARAVTLEEGYALLETNVWKVQDYLEEAGVVETEIVVDPVNTWKEFARDQYGNTLEQLIAYNLTQQVRVESADVDKVERVSKGLTTLLSSGVEVSSYPPEYIYTKMADLRVKLLEEAALDGKRRAETLAEKSGASLGDLRTARMGVFQLLPRYSLAVDDYGAFDTSSKIKDAMAVVTLTYDVARGW